MNSTNKWMASTKVFLDEFNEIARQLSPSEDDAKTDTTADTAGESDLEEAAKEREEKIAAANAIIEKIAVSFKHM